MVFDIGTTDSELANAIVGGFQVTYYLDGRELPATWVPVIVNHTRERIQFMLLHPVTSKVLTANQACSQTCEDWPSSDNVEYLQASRF